MSFEKEESALKGMDAFVQEHGFQEKSNQYYGMFNDMHMVIKEENLFVCAYLYLDLPKDGRKALRDLEKQMNETGTRYDAKVSIDLEHRGFLKIEIKNTDDALSNLERFLNNCDLLLRPYGREMGLLCAYCRREMQDVKPEYKMENGLVVPVCPDCVNLESADKAKKADNRRTIEQKRMMKGLLGGWIGCLISIALWILAGFGGSFLLDIAFAFVSVALIKRLFERMSKAPNRLNSVTVCAFAMLALLIGSAAGYTVSVNSVNESMREHAAYLISYGPEALEDYQKMEIEAFKNGDYDDITLAYTLKDPYFYKGLIVPAAAILISSFSSDSINLKQRKRR